MHSKNLDGRFLKYWTFHDSKLPTIVMIHGITGNHKGFQYIAPLLPEFHLIAPDLFGFGASDLPAREDWSIEGLARRTNEFVRSLNLPEPPIILGHSMGGLVVSAMVHQAPELFSDVILISPVPTSIRANDRRRPGAVLAALQYRLGARSSKIEKHIVKSRTISRVLTKFMMKTSDKELQKAITEHHFDNLDYISDVEFYSKLYTDINGQGAIDYAETLRDKRVALIVGDSDDVTPLREELKLRDAIAPDTFAIIEGVGHLIHYEKPREAANIIKQFLHS
jgi:pimeloyl-ACP methyl ester carboxylesterase